MQISNVVKKGLQEYLMINKHVEKNVTRNPNFEDFLNR